MTVQTIAIAGRADHLPCERIAARRSQSGAADVHERLAAAAIAACARRRGWRPRCERRGDCALASVARALHRTGRARG